MEIALNSTIWIQKTSKSKFNQLDLHIIYINGTESTTFTYPKTPYTKPIYLSFKV